MPAIDRRQAAIRGGATQTGGTWRDTSESAHITPIA
jgi:hypothetical protein